MVSGFLEGVLGYFDSLKTIRKYNLSKYFIVTGVLAIILFFGIGSLSHLFSLNFVGDWYPSNWYLSEGINNGIHWASGIILFVLGIAIYRHLLLAIMAPFMSLLSEEIERKSCGKILSNNNVFNAKGFLKAIFRGLFLAIRNLSKEMFFTVILLFLALILPPLSIFTAPLIILIQAYYAGFGNIDYTLERKFNRNRSVSFIRTHKGFAIGNGIVFIFLIYSVVGVFFAPVLAISAVTPGVLTRLGSNEE